MQLWLFKLLCVIFIIFLSLFFTLIPISLTKVNISKQQYVLSLSNAFAGGVFLASGFVHLFTEADEMVEEMEHWNEYPVAGILAVCGFLTVFFIEQVILAKMGHDHSHGIQENKEHTTVTSNNTASSEVEIELETVPPKIDIVNQINELELHACDEVCITDEHEEQEQTSTESPVKHESLITMPTLSFVSIALLVVISAHSFFTGLTMGAQTDFTSTLYLMITVISHKWVEAFALGTNLIRNGEKISSIVKLSILYTLTLPAGLICGTIIIAISATFAKTATMLATGFGSGSFIYIAIVDILVPEFEHSKNALLKFALVCFGFILISLLFIFCDLE